MKRNSTLFLMFLTCSLFSTALKAQLKTSFTLSYDTFCTSVAEHFVNTSTGGTKPYRTLWFFGDGDTSTNASPNHFYKAGNYKVTLFVLDASFDTASASKYITVIATPKPNLGPDQRGCWGHPIMLTTGLPHEPVVKWTWIKGNDTVNNAFHGDTINILDSGIYIVTVQNSAGCTGTDTANIYFNPPVHAPKVDTTVCINSTVVLRSGIGGSTTWWDIIHGNKIVGTGPTFTFLASASSGYGVAADIGFTIKNTGHGVTCIDSGYYNVSVNTPTHSQLSILKPFCITDPAIHLGGVDSLHQGGYWTYPRKPSAIVNNFLYPNIMGVTSNNPALGYIHYIYVNDFRCITEDSVRILIEPLPPVNAGRDTEICPKNGKYLLSNNFISPPGGVWFGLTGTPVDAIVYSKNMDSVFFDPTVAGIKDATYGVVYNYKGPGSPCSNSDTVYIEVSVKCNLDIQPVSNRVLNLSVYPNPFSSSATIQYSLLKPSNVSIALFDINGKQIVQVTNEMQAAGTYQAEINAEKYHLSTGVYLLKFMTEDGFVSRQIIKL